MARKYLSLAGTLYGPKLEVFLVLLPAWDQTWLSDERRAEDTGTTLLSPDENRPNDAVELARQGQDDA